MDSQYVMNFNSGVVSATDLTVTVPFGFTATAGSVLVVVATAAANQTPPAEWIERANIIGDVEVGFYIKTSANGGETSLELTQNGPRHLAFAVYEFAQGTTFSLGSAALENNGNAITADLPADTPAIAMWAHARLVNATSGTVDTTWTGATESADRTHVYAGTEGVHLAVGYVEANGGTVGTGVSSSDTGAAMGPVTHKSMLVIYPAQPTIPTENTYQQLISQGYTPLYIVVTTPSAT